MKKDYSFNKSSKEQEGIMGGMTDEIRGNSKAEIFQEYKSRTEDHLGYFNDFTPDPFYKKVCKRHMIWDPDAGEWVLRFHAHT